VKTAVATLAFLALSSVASLAAAAPLAEIVTGTVDEHELHLHVRSTLREPVAAAKASPMMPPFFAKAELEDALQKYGPYLLEHVHVQARAKVLGGKVVAAQLMDSIDGPVNQATDLEKHFADVELAYTLENQDPLTISFDVLADRELAPGAPYTVLYSLDVKGRKKWHADLTTGASYTLDIAEPSSAPLGQRERVDSTPGRRRRAGNMGFAGLAFFVAVGIAGYSILKRVRRRR
jgi:hypothetical protein